MVKEEAIRVYTKFFATIREITGKPQDTLQLSPRSTVKDFLKELSNRYGKKLSDHILDGKGGLRESLSLLVNGQAIDLTKLAITELKEGDLVVILPPIGGG